MMYTLIPLGNPGSKYANTRHNIARILLSMMLDDVMKIDSCEIVTLNTFMNESGCAVKEYLDYHEGREIIIMYDDKDLQYGTFKISYDRGDGGHNGLKSIIESLGRTDFVRIRIGIAPRKKEGEDLRIISGPVTSDYVMGQVSKDEEDSLRFIASRVLGAIQMITKDGYQKAMEVYNGKQ